MILDDTGDTFISSQLYWVVLVSVDLYQKS